MKKLFGFVSIVVILSLILGSSFAPSQIVLEREAYVTFNAPADIEAVRSMGYWKNHLKIIEDNWNSQHSWRTYVKSFNAFSSLSDDPFSAIDEIYQILDGANARDMEVMLKAQLIVMVLNIVSGYVPSNTLVDLGGARGAVALFGIDFLEAENVVIAIDNNVFTSSPTWTSRWQQEIAKDVLDAMNNNQIFVD